MEPSWSSHGFYASTYYPHDPPRSTHRPGHSLPQPATPATPGPLGPPPPDIAHRRAQTQPGPGSVPGSYLPPPPPPPIHSSSHQGHELPSFSHSFYSPYSTSTPQHQQSTSAPSGLQYHSSVPPPLPPYSGGGAGGGSSNGIAGGSSSNGFSDFPTASPGISSHLMSSSRGQFPGLTTGGFHESPRLPGSAATTSGTFSSSSPGLRNFSPTSPTTHLAPPTHSLTAVSSGGSTSSSSYLSSNPGHLPRRGEPLPSLSAGMDALAMRKKRGVSPPFNPISSWEEDIDSKYGILQSEKAGDGKHDQDRYDAHGPGSGSSKFEELPLEEYEDQPWGMPQAEYKALNSRDKKQVRNRIGARRFRAKRKNYVSSLETAVRSRDEEIRLLREQALGYRSEIDELRAQLGIHPLPELPTPQLRRQILMAELASPEAGSGALGLVVSHPGIKTVWDDEN